MTQDSGEYDVFARFASNPHIVDRASSLLTVMANAKRLQMLSLMIATELSVRELASLVHLDHSATSQHLAKLRNAGLVATRRDAQQILYHCDAGEVSNILSALITIYADNVAMD
ncbi:metalloregulator ArsR/SmtB family transcription factor [Rhizobium sp. YTUHZ044]|uniref:ArsR/SmtB family transcription factor n=1 Tax=Rhizobium sp. YTUHZ044 TaxID=2962678 RepID=UPI003DA87E1A